MPTDIDLAVSGMTCAACVARVEKKLNKVPGVEAVVNLATERAHVVVSDDSITPDQLIDVVTKAGYGATVVENPAQADDAAQTAAEERTTDLWRRFVISAALSVPVVGISMIPALQFPGWQWLVAALSLPIAFWCGWPFHKGARAGTMDTLVSLGVLASMGWSLWALLFGGAGHIGYTMHMSGIHGLTGKPHLYFESAAMIVTFLLLGRYLEAKSRRSAGDALRALLELGADQAFLVSRGGAEIGRMIPASELQVGDIFRVRPGETVAADGVVVAGHSAINASLVTGESVPIDVTVGSPVTGATINEQGSLDVRATRVGEETTLAQMGRLLAQAQTGKAPVQRIADRISSVFVPAVIVIALVTLVVRLALGNPVQMALASAITVLVVACPCALGLATPTALLAGSGKLSKLGVLIRGPEVLEGAHRAEVIMLDKTGTLTTGVMSVDEVVAHEATEAEVLTYAASLEAHSEHPIAKAIVRDAQDRGLTLRQVTGFTAVPAGGVVGEIDGERVAAGKLDWLTDHDVAPVRAAAERIAESGSTAVVVTVDRRVIGVIGVRDTLRPEAKEAVDGLRDQRLTPVLVTGDNKAAARTVAAELGIDRVHAGVLPEDKVAIVREWQQKANVAMVGDGVNDAAALAQADLSIAMGSGTDVAKAAADITIVNSDIRAIPAALRVSAATLKIIKQNLAWAFSYNLIAIPLAVGGVIVPGIAAFAMASSSVIVVLNSLRLR
ncbi:heavy metal translocating P-type ATPase [Trueperella bialowiezensis]|uniref:Cation-transporting P-type ATPase B n=1 Tax=Trueperella bialowiezensis TaxID=312285 RepID=A0A3S4YY78_9ACTO|nr:heavy metal translocating P-type ATPase [Trueperella bialowiezensis]VEI13453.1 Copper-exporting P-type ATPase A [Trueperella bialowiezensis]